MLKPTHLRQPFVATHRAMACMGRAVRSWAAVLTLLAAIACAAQVGCDRSLAGTPGAASPAAPQDPVASFKAFATRFVAAAHQNEKQTHEVQQSFVGARQASIWLSGEPQIDVRKTDSLVSPCLASLTCSSQFVFKSGDKFKTELPKPVEFAFALQETRWVLKGIILHDIDLDGEFSEAIDILQSRSASAQALAANFVAAADDAGR